MIKVKDNENFNEVEQIKFVDVFEGSYQTNFRGKGEELENYRIYGQTENGESVGDKTANLFDERYVGLSTTTYYFHINVGDGTFTLSTNAPKNSANTTNLYLIAGAVSTGASYVNNGVSLNSPHTVTSVDGYVTVAYRISGGINPSDYHAMLNTGSEPLPYEPYGYRVPVTVTNGTDTQTTNLYLPEQIRKVGDEVEYIDYKEQKLHKLTQKAPHTATLQLHYGITFDPNEGWNIFDAPEALYYAEDGLAAGTYNYTIQEEIKLDSQSYVGTYQFTLTQDVPPGGQLTLRGRQGDVNLAYGIKSDYGIPTQIRSYTSALSTTPIEEVGAVKGNNGISLGVADGSTQNLNHIKRAVYGNNNYMISTIRQYINSNASTGNMWKPQTKYDRPEFWVSNVNGFMNDIDSTFLNSVGITKKIVANSNGEYSAFYDKFFLLSQSEVYGGYRNNINEGEPYSYYSNYSDLSEAGEGNDSNRTKKEIGWEDDDPMPWYLRTYHFNNITYNNYNPFRVYTVYDYGNLQSFGASYVNGIMIVPACNIALDENYAYNGQVLHVRDQITVTKGDMTLTFDVIDIDHDEVDFYSPNSIDIEIPAITASSNTNTLSVNTTVKSSKIWGRISDPIDIEYVKDNLGNILFIKTNETEGELPLSFKGYGKDLKNYRIYGNTVSGESVGDRTGNLFDSNINVISGYLSDAGILKPATETSQITFDYIPIISGTYTFTYTVPSAYDLWFGVCTYDESRTFQLRLVSEYSGAATFTISDTTKYIRISLRGYKKTPKIMLNEGSTALPYEPYGYRVPVTVTNGTDTQTTNIYLPEPLTKSGDNADYTDFVTQKQYYIDGTSANVTLPALPTLPGTNTLSVGTTVQPSNIYLKGKIKETL